MQGRPVSGSAQAYEQLQKKWNDNIKVKKKDHDIYNDRQFFAPNVQLMVIRIFTILIYIRFNFLQYTNDQIAL
jgi:hypothetical protein